VPVHRGAALALPGVIRGRPDGFRTGKAGYQAVDFPLLALVSSQLLFFKRFPLFEIFVVIAAITNEFGLADFDDATDQLIESWYVERFLRLRQTAFRDPASYFHRFATLSEEEARAIGLSLWRTINLVNLTENILPTRLRADLILRKGQDHAVETVALRKL
jgi:hypothetical protein